MKLKSFQIKNYKSIQDSGVIQLDNGRVAVLAGQNESGKSSVLEALNAFEQGVFEKIGKALGSTFAAKQVTTVGFNNGQQVYNFITEYSKGAKAVTACAVVVVI